MIYRLNLFKTCSFCMHIACDCAFYMQFKLHEAYACAFYMQLKLHVACDFAFASKYANADANAVKNCMQLSDGESLSDKQ